MRLKRLLFLILPLFLLTSCGSVDTFAHNSFTGVKMNQNVSAVPYRKTVIDDLEIDHPENVYAVVFSSTVSRTCMNGSTLNVKLNHSILAKFDESFVNLQHIEIRETKSTSSKTRKIPVDLKLSVTTPSIKSLRFYYKTNKNARDCRLFNIDCWLNYQVLDQFVVDFEMGWMNYVQTRVSNFSTSDNAKVILGTYCTLENANISHYSSLDIDWGFDAPTNGTVFNSGFYDIDPDATSTNIYVMSCAYGGYYTNAFKDYVTANCPGFVYPEYDWILSGRDDVYQWTVGVSSITIDGVRIEHPSRVQTLYLISNTNSYLDNSGETFYLNVAKSKTITFEGNIFYNLTNVLCDNLFMSGESLFVRDIEIRLNLRCPDLKQISLTYNTPEVELRYGLYLNFNLYNLSPEKILSYYSGVGTQFVHTYFNDLVSTKDGIGQYIFGDLTELNHCEIVNYNEFVIKNSCKINSGFYDWNENCNLRLQGTHNGRGGYYTNLFKNYADLINQNFVDEGFNWESTENPEYPWTIGGIPLIDGVPIYDKSAIERVWLMTDERTYFYNGILYINISHGLDVDFDAEYTNLLWMTCDMDLFSDPTVYMSNNIEVNISITTPAFKAIWFTYNTTNSPLFRSEVFFNLYLNNLSFDKIVIEHLNGRDVEHFSLNGLYKNSIGDEEDFIIHANYVELNDCTFTDYSFIDLKLGNGIINSGKYDFGNGNPGSVVNFDAPHAGRGGYYTNSFANYLDPSGYDGYCADGYQWVATYAVSGYRWTIKPISSSLDPSPDQIQDELEKMTRMDNSSNCFFGFRIAYAYNYPGQNNKFQIQMTFNYEAIINYVNSVDESWGKDGYITGDDIVIKFQNGSENYIQYSLLFNSVDEYYYGRILPIENHVILPDDSLNPGYKIFTLDVGDLLGADKDNVSAIVNPVLDITLYEANGVTSHHFSSALHRPESTTAIDYSFEYLLNTYLSMPEYKDNVSLLRCKSDLGL